MSQRSFSDLISDKEIVDRSTNLTKEIDYASSAHTFQYVNKNRVTQNKVVVKKMQRSTEQEFASDDLYNQNESSENKTSGDTYKGHSETSSDNYTTDTYVDKDGIVQTDNRGTDVYNDNSPIRESNGNAAHYRHESYQREASSDNYEDKSFGSVRRNDSEVNTDLEKSGLRYEGNDSSAAFAEAEEKQQSFNKKSAGNTIDLHSSASDNAEASLEHNEIGNSSHAGDVVPKDFSVASDNISEFVEPTDKHLSFEGGTARVSGTSAGENSFSFIKRDNMANDMINGVKNTSEKAKATVKGAAGAAKTASQAAGETIKTAGEGVKTTVGVAGAATGSFSSAASSASSAADSAKSAAKKASSKTGRDGSGSAHSNAALTSNKGAYSKSESVSRGLSRNVKGRYTGGSSSLGSKALNKGANVAKRAAAYPANKVKEKAKGGLESVMSQDEAGEAMVKMYSGVRYVKSGAAAVKNTAQKTYTLTKDTVKVARKTGKAVYKTGRATVKTAKTTAKVTAKAARATAKAAQVTAKAAIAATKAAVEAAVAVGHALAAAISAAASAIAAFVTAFWPIILIILAIVAIVALVWWLFSFGDDKDISVDVTRTYSYITEVDAKSNRLIVSAANNIQNTINGDVEIEYVINDFEQSGVNEYNADFETDAETFIALLQTVYKDNWSYNGAASYGELREDDDLPSKVSAIDSFDYIYQNLFSYKTYISDEESSDDVTVVVIDIKTKTIAQYIRENKAEFQAMFDDMEVDMDVEDFLDMYCKEVGVFTLSAEVSNPLQQSKSTVAKRFGVYYDMDKGNALQTHNGVDLKAYASQIVYSGVRGEVVKRFTDSNLGGTVVVKITKTDEDDTVDCYVAYSHLSAYYVSVGDTVTATSKIGIVAEHHLSDDDCGTLGAYLHLVYCKNYTRFVDEAFYMIPNFYISGLSVNVKDYGD